MAAGSAATSSSGRTASTPATPALTESEVSLVSKNDREFILKNILKAISSDYDYILMDCPPSLNILTVNSLVSATGVLIPVQCEFYALQGLSELVNTVNQIQNSSNESLKIEGILHGKQKTAKPAKMPGQVKDLFMIYRRFKML